MLSCKRHDQDSWVLFLKRLRNDCVPLFRDQVACDENGIIEVETLAGFIDVLTDTKIIEVKTFCNWKHAIYKRNFSGRKFDR